VNPATLETLAEFDCTGEADVRAAVERARSAQPAWAAAGVRARAAILRNFQNNLHAKKTNVARLITQEAGKPYVEALLTEVLVALDAARFCTEAAPALFRPEPVPHGNPALKAKNGYLLRHPYGVVGIVAPWNYPLAIPAGEVLGSLMMGNAVVVKPSEFTTLTALELRMLLIASGVPEPLVQVIPGDGATGAALIASNINKLIFTGSVPTGRRVAAAAAARLLPVVLELGGKDAMLVLDDADLEVASSAAVWGSFVNAGQTCLSVERCYVHRSLYDRFLELCVAKTARLRVGDGLDPETDVGPLINERQVRTVEEHVNEAIGRGARLLAGGARLPQLGPNFYAPTVLADVDHGMCIMREETFGPVLAITPFDSDDEAVRLANDSEFGLAASIWTRNRSRGEALARHLEAGTVMVNDVVSCFGISEAPHGGIKSSGLGRTHGPLGLAELSWVQHVDSDRLPGLRKPWWYGYGGRFTQQMEGFVDWLFAPGISRRMRGGLRSAGAFFRQGRV
jgi:succinate-semialdehyde dehydrogenase/glutarate-semialdehyde dehydrogenase